MKLNNIAQEYLNNGLEIDKDYNGYCIDSDTEEIKECYGSITERFGKPTLCICFEPKPDEKTDSGVFMRKIHVDVYWTGDLETIKTRQINLVNEMREELKKYYADELERLDNVIGKVVKNEKAKPGYNRNHEENLQNNFMEMLKDVLLGKPGSDMRQTFEDHQKEETKKSHGG